LANTGFRLPWDNREIPPAGSHQAPRPLIVITTNEDRELPPAFVRRCLALQIDPGPDFPGWIKERARVHFRDPKAEGIEPDDERPSLDDDVINKAAQHLIEERQKLPPDGPRPGLAEFLDLLWGLTSLAPDDKEGQLGWLERVYEFAYHKQPA